MSAADFDRATAFVKSAPANPNSTNESKLAYYKFFKQGSEGDVTGERPGMLSFEARAKYDAWATVKGMSKDAAKAEYVALVKKDFPSF